MIETFINYLFTQLLVDEIATKFAGIGTKSREIPTIFGFGKHSKILTKKS